MPRSLSPGLAGATSVVIALWLVSASGQDPAPPSELAHPLRLTRETVVARLQALREHRPHVPGEAIVKFRAGAGARAQTLALRSLRGGGQVASAPMGNLRLVRAPEEPNAELMAEMLRRQPEVEWAEPNYVLRLHSAPNDTSYVRQWNMDAIQMPSAWDINPGGSSSVTVAVLDSGIVTATRSFPFSLWRGAGFASVTIPFVQNPDLSASRVTKAMDFAFWDGPVLDMVGHGTHVAGTILQETNNGLGLAGIAYHTNLMPLKVCIGYWEIQIVQAALNIPGYVDPDSGGCFLSELVDAIRYAADNGAHVINMSLGGPEQSIALRDAIRYAVGKGTFVAMSAGNGFETGNAVEYPSGYGPEIDGAMSVAAVGRSLSRAYYSSTGSQVEIAAPGGDVRAGGLPGTIYQVGLFNSDFTPGPSTTPRFDRYYDKPLQGTSMAAPHVAGVAALLYSQGVRNPAAIEAALKKFAEDLGPQGRDDQYGYGLVDARAALRGLGAAR
jgi:serine protease